MVHMHSARVSDYIYFWQKLRSDIKRIFCNDQIRKIVSNIPSPNITDLDTKKSSDPLKVKCSRRTKMQVPSFDKIIYAYCTLQRLKNQFLPIACLHGMQCIRFLMISLYGVSSHAAWIPPKLFGLIQKWLALCEGKMSICTFRGQRDPFQPNAHFSFSALNLAFMWQNSKFFLVDCLTRPFRQL